MVESTRNLHTVLLIGVTCVVQTMAQICPYSDPRCTCGTGSVTCYNLDTIPPLNTGVNVDYIWDLLFFDGNITRISNNSLPPGLIEIHIYRHPLTDISEDAFDTSATTLTRVSINEAQFTSLPIALKKLTKLTELQLQDVPIQVWDIATLKHISTTVEFLELSRVGLSAWPSWISDFHLVHDVYISWNTLKSIPNDAFDSVKDSLTGLDFSGVGLTQVPEVLSTLSNLNTLSLSMNNFTDVSRLETITQEPFASKLSYLYLVSVGFTTVGNFSNLTSLKSFCLYDNRISDIPAGSLPISLTELLLSNNSLSKVPKDVASMYELRVLELTNNFITSIEPNSFPSSLEYIYLDLNNLTTITNTTFRNLNLLGTLKLDSNPISTIALQAFSDLVTLKSLSISHSRLVEIPLAVTVLNSRIDISLGTTQPLACQCPTPQALVQWFTSLENPTSIKGVCSNGQPINSYLSGQCGPTSTSP